LFHHSRVNVMMMSAYQAQLRFSLSSCSISRLVTSIRVAWTPRSIHGKCPRPDRCPV
jgi:hypothetical protein